MDKKHDFLGICGFINNIGKCYEYLLVFPCFYLAANAYSEVLSIVILILTPILGIILLFLNTLNETKMNHFFVVTLFFFCLV